jgi:hypothetical protein
MPGEGRTTGTHLPWMCDLTSLVHFKPSWWGQIGLTYSPRRDTEHEDPFAGLFEDRR